LADMHVHVLRDKWPVSQLKLYLANGVTTIRSLGTTADEKDHRTVVNWSYHTTLFIFEDADTRLLEGSDELLGRAECKYLPEEMIRELSQGKDWFIEYLKEFKEFWHFLFEDVGNIKYHRGVMVAGRWYSKAKLQEMISLNN